MKVCYTCKKLRDIIYTDELSRGYCGQCHVPRDVLYAMSYLALTTPFNIGDRVECRIAGEIYDGIGVVEEISTDLKDGGTWVYPAFRVRFEEKAYDTVPDLQWYTEICLKRVEDKVTAND